MNLVLKFLAEMAGVQPMTATNSDDPAPGARILTSGTANGNYDALSQQPSWATSGTALGTSRRKSFTPSWQRSGLVSISRLGAGKTLCGTTVMRDVSYSQTVCEPLVLGS